MSTKTLDREPELARHDVRTRSTDGSLTRILLTCGVVYSALYVIANDIIAAMRYEGYSRTSQAISELSATGAPTRSFLTATIPVFSALTIAFGVGVWRSARGARSLRVTGALLVGYGVSAVLWVPFPMSSRAEMVEGTMPANDVGHIALTAVTVLLILSSIAFGAASFGKRFRLYSVVSAAAVVVGGGLTGIGASKIAQGEPTPWMGLFERASVGAWLLWIAVFAVALIRAEAGRAPSSAPRTVED